MLMTAMVEICLAQGVETAEIRHVPVQHEELAWKRSERETVGSKQVEAREGGCPVSFLHHCDGDAKGSFLLSVSLHASPPF